MNLNTGRSLERHEIAELLTEARTRTLLLVAAVSDRDLKLQHSRLMSPIVWDLGHIARFEEVWLMENVGSEGAGDEGLDGVYDPFSHPRATRDELPLPSASEAKDYLADVRRAVLDRLVSIDLDAPGPLLRDGYVFRMVLQHEYQHNETILQTLQLKNGEPYRAPRSAAHPRPRPGAAPGAGVMLRCPGGEVPIGTDDRTAAYDNERPRHTRRIDPFWIDAAPVTEVEYLAFVEDGGYERPELWSEEGWAWAREEELEAPMNWERSDGRWTARVMDRRRSVETPRAVCHVSYHEASAYARWAEKRLPTEAEWEAAASWDPETGSTRTYPWGEEPPSATMANLDQLAFDTAPVGSFHRNVSPIGCYGMIGDVWEWTASDFRGYPGFRSFPYPEYSEVFFGGDFKVLRGGSWATRPGAVRNTFRNWDYPIRRQIFAGFRCARDE